LDSFGQPIKDALRSASKMAFGYVELPVTGPQVDPATLSRSGRRHLSHYVSDLGLQVSAFGADLGGARFTESASLDQRLAKTFKIMEMAGELRVPVVTTHLGRVDEQVMAKGHLAEAVRQLAEFSDRTGTRVAFETGSADPEDLARLLADVDCPTLGACYDPASLLVEGFDPLSGVNPLADKILIARVRDAFAGFSQRPGRETAIGQGQIDFAEYLAALDQAGYRSTAFLRRTQSERPLEEMAQAKQKIESLLR